MTGKLHIYSNGKDWHVGESVDEAGAGFARIPDETEITIFSEDYQSSEKKTAAELASERGRGHLSSGA